MTSNEKSLLLDVLPKECCETYCSSEISRQHALPNTFKISSSTATDDDVDFLSRKGVLTVPCNYIRRELVLAFLKYTFPLLPVVSLEHLEEMAATATGMQQLSQRCEISLPLFHAVLFAGSQFVDMKILHDLGFQSRRRSCSHFHKNAAVSQPLKKGLCKTLAN